MNSPLSEVRQRILEFVHRYVEDNDRPPTLEEIQKATGLSSRANVKYHVDNLIEAGYMRKKPGSRGFEIIFDVYFHHQVTPVRVPIVGTVAAGLPIEAYTIPEDFFVSHDLAQTGDFALRVKGTSMIEDHIEDGDVVIVRSLASPNDGDIVVALILNEPGESGVATLKRFYREWPQTAGDSGRIRLEPRNPTMLPIYVHPDQVKIQGKVVAVIRKLA
jgi:repressor LexA